MKNKAFTLVELLGVIVLLGILGVVIIPKVGDSISNSREKAYETQLSSIKKGAIDFLADNTEVLESNNTITIKLGTLKQGGYLPINIKNPKTRKNFSNESLITITKSGETYNISLSMQDLQNVTENIDENSPILVLNGSYVEYVEVNSEYTDLGAKAYSNEGIELSVSTPTIKLNDEVKSQVDTSNLNTYSIIYEVTDANNKTTSATRTVIVRDSTSPIITVPKETNLHVSEVATFNRTNGVSVTDNYDNNVILTVDSTLANLPGNYIITYTATDHSGNKTTERRVINVNNDWSQYYTNVEYIESNGTQYIDTGYIANQNTEYEIVSQLNREAKADGALLGSRTGSNSSNSFVLWHNNVFQLNTETVSPCIGNNQQTTNDSSSNFEYKKFEYKNNNFYINGNLEYTFNNNIADNNLYLTLFALNQNNVIDARRYKGRIKYFKIWDNGTLVRNMIPCIRKKDNEVGLYDLANNKFYTNSGTGSFGYKKQNENQYERLYTKLEYIESTGTQYIDTGYIANQNTEYEIVSQLNPETQADGALFGSRNMQNSTWYNAFVLWHNNITEQNTETVSPCIGNNPQISNYSSSNFEYRKFEYKNNNFYIDGNLEYTFNNNIADNNLYLTLFALNQNNAIDARRYKGRIKYFKIWDNGILVRNFVPVVRNSDNMVGLYDEVNDAFYKNRGTGEFIKGEL